MVGKLKTEVESCQSLGMRYTTTYESPCGQILLASDGDNLTGCWFIGAQHYAQGLLPSATARELTVFKVATTWFDAYFAGLDSDQLPALPPLQAQGTSFQQQVWQLLAEISYGTTRTYGELAQQLCVRLGKPRMSAQAVGNAIGRNPLSLFVPCHRVVGADGQLTGYAGGLDRKRFLLALEAA